MGRFLLAVLLCCVLPAAAQEPYPARPVRIVVPYAPGGATDIIARIVAQRLTESMGQTFLVENRPGATGNLALESVAKAPADGYTLLVGNVSTNAINENTFAHTLQIKPSRDLVGIAKLVEIPHIIAASTAFSAVSLSDLISEAKRNPGKINFASAGLGSYPHLDMEKFQRAAGIQLTHIPYKDGAGRMVPSLLADETQVAFINLSSTLPHIRAGRMKALATTAPARLPEMPNVPTLAELGYAGIGTNAWQGMFAPAATPKPVIDKLHGAVLAALTKTEQKEGLAKQMMSVEVSKSPQEFTELVRRETQSWGEFLRDAGIKID
ncbi:MAG TPA: tripartite tricarboxylate transporter substrate binding protein [Burkholderiales bacterium]|nr:tripartite tricarboxylate transporter substrate binding protein [Burkholderiales bacterium]